MKLILFDNLHNVLNVILLTIDISSRCQPCHLVVAVQYHCVDLLKRPEYSFTLYIRSLLQYLFFQTLIH